MAQTENYNAFIVLSSFFALGVFTTNYIVYTCKSKYRWQNKYCRSCK